VTTAANGRDLSTVERAYSLGGGRGYKPRGPSILAPEAKRGRDGVFFKSVSGKSRALPVLIKYGSIHALGKKADDDVLQGSCPKRKKNRRAALDPGSSLLTKKRGGKKKTGLLKLPKRVRSNGGGEGKSLVISYIAG